MSKPIPPEATRQIAELVFAGNKIAAIRLYREHSGEGLKESKDFVEALERSLRASDPGRFAARSAGRGCLGMAALCGIGALGLSIAVLRLLR